MQCCVKFAELRCVLFPLSCPVRQHFVTRLLRLGLCCCYFAFQWSVEFATNPASFVSWGPLPGKRDDPSMQESKK